MELSISNILSIVETNRESRAAFVRRTVSTIKEGNADPLQTWIYLKNWESLIKELLGNEELRDLSLTEGIKYGKSFERFNAKVEQAEVGTDYDWSGCNDPELETAIIVADNAKKALKTRQKFLKTIPATGLTITNEDTGEVTTIYPPIKTSTSSLKVTLK